jgi:hypothetical protein
MLRHQPNIPTVRIQHPDVPGGLVINARDFDPAVHQRFGAAADEGGLDRLTVKQLTAKLEAAGVEIPEGAKKADLVALLSGEAAEDAEDADEA